MFRLLLVLVWLVVAAAATWSGLDYYRTPLADRVYSEAHDLFAPTGLLGQGYGIVGTLMIVTGVVLYTARKRIALLSRLGRLRAWLEFHIFLCTLGPFLILLHTTFKFGGIVSIAFWAMIAVVTSGVFGRYVYVWIPKTVNGHFLTTDAISREQGRLLDSIRSESDFDASFVNTLLGESQVSTSVGLVSALTSSVRYRFGRRRASRQLDARLREAGVSPSLRPRILGLAEQRRRLSQQAGILQPFQRLFRYWHAFHLPLAVVMLLVLSVHVGVSVWLGYTWIF